MTDSGRTPEPLPSGIEQDGVLDCPGLGTAAWFTDVGHLRSRNEDRFLVKGVWGGEWVLLLVADGAGGHDSGDKAAEAVIATFDARFPADGSVPKGDAASWLMDAALAAHESVKGLGQGQARPPASTVVALLLERASVCGWRLHVGDSRLYVRQGDGVVAQWTRDHNITNGLIDRGLPVAQAMKIAEGGRLTQILGGGADPEPEVHGPLAFTAGQTVLLCSDGVYGHNGEREVLLPAMDPRSDLAERGATLKAAVLDGPAPDNLTAVLFQFADDVAATAERPTVTNSMRAVSQEDIEARLARKVAQDLGLTEPETPPQRGVPAAIWLVAVALLLAAFFGVRSCAGPEPTAPAPEELPGEPQEVDPLSIAADGYVAALDPAVWSALPEEERRQIRMLLKQIVPIVQLRAVVLRWAPGSDAPVQEAELLGWPQPGGANQEAARSAWQAAEALRRAAPDIAAQAALAPLLQRAACAALQTDWPAAGPTTPERLAEWIAACLPEGGDDSVRIRLGAWPERGLDASALNRLRAMALGAEPLAELELAADGDDRARELFELGAAALVPDLSDLSIQVTLVLPPSDAPPDADPGAVASQRGAELRALLPRGPAIRTGGRFDDGLVRGLFDGADGAALADQVRHLEVELRRLGDLPDEPAVAPPGEPPVAPAVTPPGEPTAPPGEPTTAPTGESAPDPAR